MAGGYRFKARAFTLVELLVVVGIVGLLVALIMPAVFRARVRGRRIEDLNHIRQLAQACFTYATESHGDWPLGCRQGPNTANAASNNDDLNWINTYTFGYLLRFVANPQVANDWMSTTAPWPGGKMIDPSVQRNLACVSAVDYNDGGQFMSCVGYRGYRYLQVQTDPAGTCMTSTFMGYLYWGRRAQHLQGDVYSQQGTWAAPGSTFTFPTHQGKRSTSAVLWTCPAFSSDVEGTQMPHCFRSDDFYFGNDNVASPENGRTGYTSIMNGICCAYTDGSASWVPRPQLASVYQGSSNW